MRLLWLPSHASIRRLLHIDAIFGQVEVAAGAGVGVAVGGVGNHVLIGVVVIVRVSACGISFFMSLDVGFEHTLHNSSQSVQWVAPALHLRTEIGRRPA